jgi:hypothetical protein
MMWWWLAQAVAGIHVVVEGETVESILKAAGAPAMAAEVRQDNGLSPGVQPPVGAILRLPAELPGGDCQPSYLWFHTGEDGVITFTDGVQRDLVDWMPLLRGTEVCSNSGYATLRIAERVGSGAYDDVTLLPNTCLVVRESEADDTGARTSLLSLRQGSLRIPEMAAGRGMVIVETAAGITLGRTGGFRVAVEEGATGGAPDATRTEAVDGDVLTLAQGSQVAVPEGFGNRVREGDAPGVPVPLAPRPTPNSPRGELVVPDFVWRPSEGVLSYVVEFSSTSDFRDLLLSRAAVADEVRALPRGDLSWLPGWFSLPVTQGTVFWHVVGVDRLGFLGLPSEPFRVQLTQPPPAP